jgi:hypothetical protein
MLVCVSALIVRRQRLDSIFFDTVDQQAALRWVQKYVSLLVLMIDICVRRMILLVLRSVDSAETQKKLRSGETQPALAQFYNMLLQMVGKHHHHFSERQLRARHSCHLNTIITIAFQRYEI